MTSNYGCSVPLMGLKIAREGSRYVVYLPRQYNEVWEEWWRGNAKINIYIEVAGKDDD